MKKLTGKVALITGASGGIGSAIARRFAESGIDLALCGRSEEKLAHVRQAAEALGVRTMVYTGDLTADGAGAKRSRHVKDLPLSRRSSSRRGRASGCNLRRRFGRRG